MSYIANVTGNDVHLATCIPNIDMNFLAKMPQNCFCTFYAASPEIIEVKVCRYPSRLQPDLETVEREPKGFVPSELAMFMLTLKPVM